MRIRRSTPGPGLSVGIDLGTTYSAVARVDASGVPEILPNRDGEAITPSVVLFDGEQPIVGTMAKRSVTSAPLDVVQLVKRSMGDRSWRFETAGGTAWRPEEISALILKRLKADAEAVLGSEVSDAVITVPAYFDDAPRRATIDAGTIAGFNVRRVLNEPTAAALAYGMRGDVDGTVLVYDLGGGTFDVTAMRISSGEFRVLATFGDRNLGGFDFDNALIRLLDERFVAAGGRSLLGDDISEVELREKAELAKHALTTVPRTQVSLSVDGFSSVVGVSRADFEDVTSALLSRTREIASMVVEEAGLSWSGVDRVLLAGGSTRMPMVRGMLEQLSGRTPDASANPDQVVAHGAAIQAHLLDLAAAESRSPARIRRPEATGAGLRRLTIHDVTSQGLGALYYERVGNSEREKGNRIVIPANTPIPAHGTNTWKTLRDNQSAINWVVTQGNDDDPRYVRRVGTGSTPLPLYPAGSEVELTFSYDHNQIIEITARDLTSGHSIGGFTVDGVQNMSADDVARSERRIRPIDPA